MRGRVFAGLTIPLLLSAAPLAAQAPAPRIYFQGDLPVAEQTTNNQGRSSVAAGANGEYLVVWNSDAKQQFYSDIKAQRFNRSGQKIEIEFQVDQAADNRIQFTPRVARAGNDRYIVVWADFNQTVTDAEVYFRAYDAVGSPITNALQVNAFTTGRQRLPAVAGNGTGDWVAIWESENQDGDGWGIVGQRYDSNFNKVGPEFVVNTIVEGDQNRPAVAYSDAGTFVVTWDSYYNASFGVEVFAQEFDADGPVGSPISVSASSPGDQQEAVVAALEANAWAFAYRDGSNIVMRQYRDGVLGGRILASGLTPGAKGSPRIANSPIANLTAVAWHCFGKDDPNDANGAGVFGQLYQLDDNLFREKGDIFQVNAFTTGTQWIPDVAIAQGGQLRLTWQSSLQDGSADGVFSAIGNDPVARAWAVDTQPSGGTSNRNSVAERLERILMIPRVRNTSASPLLILSATIVEDVELTRAQTATATIDDGTADYGAIPTGTTADCFSTTGDCYEVTITGPRPAPHWDEAFRETLSTGLEKPFLLHVGESFNDVPTSNLFYAFIENLFHNGITAGGACGGYCPTDGVKRQQMAVFLLKSRFGSAFTPPPASGTIFGDVPASNPFAPWIELLSLLGITGGCQASPPLFCPDAIVNRQQMAVFLLKMKEGSTYAPPACTGIFQDVLCTNPFSKWIEELYNRQVTGGCVANPLQYCPTNPTNRQQMAVFLVKTFGLLLYGP